MAYQKDNLSNALKDLIEQKIKFRNTRSKLLRSVQAHTKIYYKHLKKYGFDVFDPVIQYDPSFKALRVWYQTKCL